MDLGEATRRAVEQSRPYAVWLSDLLGDLSGTLRKMPRPQAAADYPDLRESAKLDRVLVEAVVDELLATREVLRGSIDHFNIVLFGRTMAGKSTAIETLIGGDGRSISDGQCDNTVEVEKIDLDGYRLYDTPGVDGWGRSVEREQLEELAEGAVAEADLVVLCFDSFGQQDTEFGKVASWVAAYGKPAVALFNVKNALWRMPNRVGDPETRLRLSETVAEHAGHIAAGLAEIGLGEVPIVAVHSHRAFTARASDDYAGPNAVAIHRQRADLDAGTLWEWSNFGTFTGLVETAIATDAVELRLGRVFQQVIGALDRADVIFYQQVEEPAEATAEPIEDGLRRILTQLGEPAAGNPQLATLRAHLAELRGVHGRPIEVVEAGTAQRYARDVIASATTALRTAALHKADEAVDAAISSGTKWTSEQFVARVFDSRAAEERSRQVLTDLSKYLDEGLGLAVADMRAEVKLAEKATDLVDGRAGRHLRKWGYGVQYGGVAAGAVAIAIGISPIGWAIGTGVLVAAGVSLVAGWVGKLLRRNAAAKKAEAQNAARLGARQAVNDALDGFEQALLGQFDAMIANGQAGAAAPAAARAVHLRRSVAAVNARRATIQAHRRAVDDTKSSWRAESRPGGETEDWTATDILRAAEVRYEQTTGLIGADLWLGESWIEAEERPEVVVTVAARPAAPRPRRVFRQFRRTLRTFTESITAVPRPGSAKEWLGQARDVLGHEPGFRPYLDELSTLDAGDKPRVVLCGDYDTGKSSFIRRLLVDAGLPVPHSLKIRGNPTTAVVAEYDCGDFILVDTPGFHSGVPAHTEVARAALADAAGVLYLFGGNLVRADRTDLTAVLAGDPEVGLPAKAGRALFVINRADELCPDPVADLDGYAKLCDRKREELHTALGTPSVSLDQIFCIAADPFQSGGRRPADYDAFRDWDGVDELREALADITARLRVNAGDVAILGGGLTRVARWRTGLSAELAAIDERTRQIDQLIIEMQRREQTGRAMAKERSSALGRQLSDFAMALVREAFAQPEGGQERLALRLDNLAEDQAFIDLVNRWQKTGAKQIKGWCKEARKGLSVLVDRESFAQAFPDRPDSPNTDVLRRSFRRNVRDVVRGATGFLAKAADRINAARAAKATADVVAKASSLAKFSVALQGVTMLWDVYSLIREAKEEEARARAEIKLRAEVDATAQALAAAYVATDPSLAELDAVLRALGVAQQQLSREAENEEEPAAAVRDRIRRCDDIAADARHRLGTEENRHGR
ncbi:putative GTPase [Actinoplanes tereljensis]|nr:GTPase [Actinoplanes tereljensis]